MSIGSTAAQILCTGAQGRVAAVFDSSVYLATNDQKRYVCLLPASAPEGPLHVRGAWPAANITRRFQVDEPWFVEAAILQCGQLRLALGNASPWSPADIDSLSEAASIRAPALGSPRPGLPVFAAAKHSLSSAWGQWHKLVHRSAAIEAVLYHAGPWPIFAHQALDTLRTWIDTSAGEERLHEAVSGLIGLGEGLTPAGDDLLGGLALILRAQGSARLTPLVYAITRCLHQTHPISAAHLFEALHGRPTAPALKALRAVFSGNLACVEAACTQLGHTSGWDMLAGMLLGLSTEVVRKA